MTNTDDETREKRTKTFTHVLSIHARSTRSVYILTVACRSWTFWVIDKKRTNSNMARTIGILKKPSVFLTYCMFCFFLHFLTWHV
jgi:branched-subunit amino acid transport protein AzlD